MGGFAKGYFLVHGEIEIDLPRAEESISTQVAIEPARVDREGTRIIPAGRLAKSIYGISHRAGLKPQAFLFRHPCSTVHANEVLFDQRQKVLYGSGPKK